MSEVSILLIWSLWDWFKGDIVKFAAKQFYKLLLKRIEDKKAQLNIG